MKAGVLTIAGLLLAVLATTAACDDGGSTDDTRATDPDLVSVADVECATLPTPSTDPFPEVPADYRTGPALIDLDPTTLTGVVLCPGPSGQQHVLEGDDADEFATILGALTPEQADGPCPDFAGEQRWAVLVIGDQSLTSVVLDSGHCGTLADDTVTLQGLADQVSGDSTPNWWWG